MFLGFLQATKMLLSLLLCVSLPSVLSHQETVSRLDTEKYSMVKEKRYILYDINHGEGFNLRRDVYMRIANTVRMLREAGENAVLVLPPWGGLYHWERQETKVRWDTFFDTVSMNRFVPVVEFEDFLKENPSQLIDQVVYLQPYAEGWGGEYTMKWGKRECIDGQRYYKREEGEKGLWKGWFFAFTNVRARAVECVSFQGLGATLVEMIQKDFENARVLFIDRMEAILHDRYGDMQFWNARRSMRYAERLRGIGDEYRSRVLDSTDEKDDTVMPERWETPKESMAKGGPYLCAHWRRKDFVRAHGNELPSLEGAAKLLNNLAKENSLDRIFVSTDAPKDEVERLRKLLKRPLHTFDSEELTDGEVAVVHQWICAHARFFTGSHVSTFSYRIQEDREILNFPPETTFNRMCPDAKPKCEQPAKWRIKYEDEY